ncbi:ArsR/SmtB family transcription factor [Geomonas subterranea]|uniref:ArsR/SmtB family transcription factor n=1 Tax=Geomonas subterranea TaxID=2847989 RepID=UPI001CD6EFA3|nr:metalloregulator ArsR/SmtB family transcription factor [Geomonas fuzhouensis]
METISAYSAEVLRLLGQITRLRIVEALREKELYVSEIFTILEEEQSNVSKHLSQMAKNGILGTRKDPESPKCYYRVKLTGIFGIIDLAKRLVEREREGLQGVAALPFVADVLKEIGQPSRMAIIAALRAGEMQVSDIVKAVELERSNTSRHLSGMKAAGVVARRVDERMQAHYRLTNDYTLRIVDLTRLVVERDVRNRQEALLRGMTNSAMT